MRSQFEIRNPHSEIEYPQPAFRNRISHNPQSLFQIRKNVICLHALRQAPGAIRCQSEIRNPHSAIEYLATCNSQLATRTPCPAPRNPHPV